MAAPDASTLIALLEDAVQADPGSLGPDTVLEGLDGWDSMGVVWFLGEVADRWDGFLSAEDVAACPTVRDLIELVRRAS